MTKLMRKRLISIDDATFVELESRKRQTGTPHTEFIRRAVRAALDREKGLSKSRPAGDFDVLLEA